MTAPLDIIVTPRHEPAKRQAPKSDRATSEPVDNFADHLPQGQAVRETATPPENGSQSRKTENRSQDETPRIDHIESEGAAEPEDATLAQTSVTLDATPEQENQITSTTPQLSEANAAISIQINIAPEQPIHSGEKIIAAQIIANPARTHDPKVAPTNSSQNTVIEGQTLTAPAPLSAKQPFLGQDAEIPPIRPANAQQTPSTSPSQTILGAPQSPDAPPLAQKPGQKTPDAAKTDLTTNPISAKQNAIPATPPASNSQTGQAAPPSQNAAADPLSQPTTFLTGEQTPPAGGTPETKVSALPVDSSKPLLVGDAPQVQGASVQTGKTAPQQPSQIAMTPGETSAPDPMPRDAHPKNDTVLAGNTDPATLQKSQPQKQQSLSNASDKPGAQNTPTDVPNAQSTQTRAPLPAQSPPMRAPLEQQALIETQPGAPLTVSAPAPGARPLLFEQTLAMHIQESARAASLPVKNIAVQMAKNLKSGVNRFEIRLDPPEMGRIHVRMEMTHDGRVQAILSAERSDTLDLLQRDAKILSQSLDEAGLDVDSDSLQFSLHDDGNHSSFANSNFENDETLRQDVNLEIESLLEATATTVTTETYGFKISSQAGINIQI